MYIYTQSNEDSHSITCVTYLYTRISNVYSNNTEDMELQEVDKWQTIQQHPTINWCILIEYKNVS